MGLEDIWGLTQVMGGLGDPQPWFTHQTRGPSVAGHHGELLFAGSLWVWQVFPTLLYPTGCMGLCETISGLCTQTFLLWGQCGVGLSLPLLSGFPDLTVGSVITLSLRVRVSLLSQSPAAYRKPKF